MCYGLPVGGAQSCSSADVLNLSVVLIFDFAAVTLFKCIGVRFYESFYVTSYAASH